jgi:hypothetical protein
MKRAMLGIGDRMLAALLPREDAAACFVARCTTTTCVPHGVTGCQYICEQVCKSSSGQVCYSDWYCSG